MAQEIEDVVIDAPAPVEEQDINIDDDGDLEPQQSAEPAQKRQDGMNRQQRRADRGRAFRDETNATIASIVRAQAAMTEQMRMLAEATKAGVVSTGRLAQSMTPKGPSKLDERVGRLVQRIRTLKSGDDEDGTRGYLAEHMNVVQEEVEERAAAIEARLREEFSSKLAEIQPRQPALDSEFQPLAGKYPWLAEEQSRVAEVAKRIAEREGRDLSDPRVRVRTVDEAAARIAVTYDLPVNGKTHPTPRGDGKFGGAGAGAQDASAAHDKARWMDLAKQWCRAVDARDKDNRPLKNPDEIYRTYHNEVIAKQKTR